MLIILVVLFKGNSNLLKMTDVDITFIRSDQMKWGIIIIAVILIMGTMVDLYFSLVVRTFYLTFMTYPDIILSQEEVMAAEKQKKALLKNLIEQSPSKK